MDTREVIGRPQFGQGQSVAYTGTAGTITNTLPEGTTAVRVMTTSDAYIRIGVSPTAVTTDLFLPAYMPEYFPVYAIGPNLPKVSAVQVSAAGTLYVMPF